MKVPNEAGGKCNTWGSGVIKSAELTHKPIQVPIHPTHFKDRNAMVTLMEPTWSGKYCFGHPHKTQSATEAK